MRNGAAPTNIRLYLPDWNKRRTNDRIRRTATRTFRRSDRRRQRQIHPSKGETFLALTHRYFMFLNFSLQKPGYSTKFKDEALESHEYPNGKTWHKLFASGLFKKPTNLSE